MSAINIKCLRQLFLPNSSLLNSDNNNKVQFPLNITDHGTRKFVLEDSVLASYNTGGISGFWVEISTSDSTVPTSVILFGRLMTHVSTTNDGPGSTKRLYNGKILFDNVNYFFNTIPFLELQFNFTSAPNFINYIRAYVETEDYWGDSELPPFYEVSTFSPVSIGFETARDYTNDRSNSFEQENANLWISNSGTIASHEEIINDNQDRFIEHSGFSGLDYSGISDWLKVLKEENSRRLSFDFNCDISDDFTVHKAELILNMSVPEGSSIFSVEGYNNNVIGNPPRFMGKGESIQGSDWNQYTANIINIDHSGTRSKYGIDFGGIAKYGNPYWDGYKKVDYIPAKEFKDCTFQIKNIPSGTKVSFAELKLYYSATDSLNLFILANEENKHRCIDSGDNGYGSWRYFKGGTEEVVDGWNYCFLDFAKTEDGVLYNSVENYPDNRSDWYPYVSGELIGYFPNWYQLNIDFDVNYYKKSEFRHSLEFLPGSGYVEVHEKEFQQNNGPRTFYINYYANEYEGKLLSVCSDDFSEEEFKLEIKDSDSIYYNLYLTYYDSDGNPHVLTKQMTEWNFSQTNRHTAIVHYSPVSENTGRYILAGSTTDINTVAQGFSEVGDIISPKTITGGYYDVDNNGRVEYRGRKVIIGSPSGDGFRGSVHEFGMDGATDALTDLGTTSLPRLYHRIRRTENIGYALHKELEGYAYWDVPVSVSSDISDAIIGVRASGWRNTEPLPKVFSKRISNHNVYYNYFDEIETGLKIKANVEIDTNNPSGVEFFGQVRTRWHDNNTFLWRGKTGYIPSGIHDIEITQDNNPDYPVFFQNSPLVDESTKYNNLGLLEVSGVVDHSIDIMSKMSYFGEPYSGKVKVHSVELCADTTVVPATGINDIDLYTEGGGISERLDLFLLNKKNAEELDLFVHGKKLIEESVDFYTVAGFKNVKLDLFTKANEVSSDSVFLYTGAASGINNDLDLITTGIFKENSSLGLFIEGKEPETFSDSVDLFTYATNNSGTRSFIDFVTRSDLDNKNKLNLYIKGDGGVVTNSENSTINLFTESAIKDSGNIDLFLNVNDGLSQVLSMYTGGNASGIQEDISMYTEGIGAPSSTLDLFTRGF